MRLLFLLLVMTFSTPVLAEGGHLGDLLTLPVQHTIVTLTANENVDVEQDLLTASLAVEGIDDDHTTLQNTINKTMKQAMDIISKKPKLQAQTTHYNIHEFYPNRNQRTIKKWKGEQGVTIKSTDKDTLLQLVGLLQGKGLILKGLDFSVSQSLQEKTQDALLENLISKLQVKADRIAKTMSKNQAEILEIRLDDQNKNAYQPQYRSMHMESATLGSAPSTPVASAGQTNISVSASAHVLIKP